VGTSADFSWMPVKNNGITAVIRRIIAIECTPINKSLGFLAEAIHKLHVNWQARRPLRLIPVSFLQAQPTLCHALEHVSLATHKYTSVQASFHSLNRRGGQPLWDAALHRR
jgi:hypothetical protein